MEVPPSVTDTTRVRQDVQATPAPGAASATAPTQSRSTGTGDTTLGASLELTVDGWPPVEGQQWCTEVFYLPLPAGAGQTGAVGRCSAIPRCRLLAPM